MQQRRDELGEVARTLKLMKTSLKELLVKIKQQTNNVKNIVTNVCDAVILFNNNMEEISEAAQKAASAAGDVNAYVIL